MSSELKLSPVDLVIFGAAGDLTWRKLIPAIYALFLSGSLPDQFAVFGVDGKPMPADDWRKRLREGIDQFSRHGKAEPAEWKEFATHLIDCARGDFGDVATFKSLAEGLEQRDRDAGEPVQHVFYLATPPSVVQSIVENLGKAGLTKDTERSRVVFEKPFGHDLDSAHAINQFLLRSLDESQIYRIDHFLGKETVQNILAFRFANAMFEPVWDRRYIDHVQITVAEQVGVEHRGKYYERAGAARDMIQNHLMQILSLIAMEPPAAFSADEIRARKVDVLRAVRPILPEDVHQHAARGQYAAGWLEGQRVPAYRDEPDVDPASATETFAALKLFIDNWRWQDVPFYMRTGKRMASNFVRSRIDLFRRPSVWTGSPTAWRSRSSRKRASTCVSRPNSPASSCASAHSRCSSAIARRSRPIRPKRTKRCCWMSCWATRPSSCAPTRWNAPGK